MQFEKLAAAALLLSTLAGAASAQEEKADQAEKKSDPAGAAAKVEDGSPAAAPVQDLASYAVIPTRQNPFVTAVNPMAPAVSYLNVDDTLLPMVNPAVFASEGALYSTLLPRPSTVVNSAGVSLHVLADGTIGNVYQNGQQLPASCVVQNGASLDVMTASGDLALALSASPGGGYLIPSGCYATILPNVPCPPKIGVDVVPLDPALAKHLGLDPQQAIVVAEVEDGGPAQQAGIEQYDVIVEVNGQSPVSAESLRESVAATAVGAQLRVEVQRGMKRIECVVTTVAAAAIDLTTFSPPTVTWDLTQGAWNPALVPTVIPTDYTVFPPDSAGGVWSPSINIQPTSVPTIQAPGASGQVADPNAPAMDRRVAELEARVAELLARQEKILQQLANRGDG